MATTRSPHLQPAVKQAVSPAQRQKLMASPKMDQAFELLQLPTVELSYRIAEAIAENPLLEEEALPQDTDLNLEALELDTTDPQVDLTMSNEREMNFHDDYLEILQRLDQEIKGLLSAGGAPLPRRATFDASLIETTIAAEESLFGKLMHQAHDAFVSQHDLKLAELIIGNLNESGYLATSLEEIAQDTGAQVDQLERILGVVQTFSPAGVGARSLYECLLIQLEQNGRQGSLAYRIVQDCYNHMLQGDYKAIAKDLNISPEQARHIIATDIRALTPRPGNLHDHEVYAETIPDILIHEETDDCPRVEIANEGIPTLRLNTRYVSLLSQPDLAPKTRKFIERHLAAGAWLMHNLLQREETLTKIAIVLLDRQAEFFPGPDGKLHPLTLKQVADATGLHETTIARATANKTLSCSRGIFPLRHFFQGGYGSLAAHEVQRLINDWIADEDPINPLSDNEIAARLYNERGIPCARRTVAKYRGILGLPNSYERRAK